MTCTEPIELRAGLCYSGDSGYRHFRLHFGTEYDKMRKTEMKLIKNGTKRQNRKNDGGARAVV